MRLADSCGTAERVIVQEVFRTLQRIVRSASMFSPQYGIIRIEARILALLTIVHTHKPETHEK
ncbi:MAG: hypothetical protein A3J67_00790 [Parcubacteria group bacterium RIFCSPHIGHO2_02_FULL_48_10b]|nr:MAG: hypothetical protein A3J67_00790 [Parcubacteria group bacterium RIFCSPHIGHO2_02_FULL_48_10b]